jgi:pyrroloquinoline quinone (PQQ) biosynthesis protein C
MILEIEPLELRRPKTGFAAEVMAELAPRYDAMTNHPIVEDVVAGVASMELIRGFTKEFIPIVRGTYRRMSMRLQHCAAHDYELQNALIKEVAEEVFHTPMYYAFCKKIGLKMPGDFLEMYLPETYAFILFVDATSAARSALEECCVRVFEEEAWDGFNNYSQHSSLVQTISATGLALRGFPFASDKLAAGFQEHYGCSEKDVEFWSEHGTLDLEHADVGVDIVDRYATTPELQRRAREAATLSMELWLAQWDAIYRKFGPKAQSQTQ